MEKLTYTECITLIFGSTSGPTPFELDTDAVYTALQKKGLKERALFAIDTALGQHTHFQRKHGKSGTEMVATVRQNFAAKLDALLKEAPDFLELTV